MPLPSLLSIAAQPRALLGALALTLLGACQSAPTAAPAVPSAAQPAAAAVSAPQTSSEAAPEALILGGHTDAHGCKPSTGNSWCQRTQRCERPWELALQRGFENTPAGWHAYCDGSTR
ncbi:hypothetical protein [Comamonas sp. GB3 AK4-5]|uniref:hypothetical protein n=1 Tax=Comamonas sp. GB3 AK4-5 TaxID=3231487 RepID=UPI00351E41FE